MSVRHREDVLLANMPFGPFTQPAIGLSLIRECLPAALRSDIRYFNVEYADAMGPELYLLISTGFPRFTDLVGEWIFSAAACGTSEDDARYVDEVLANGREFDALRARTPLAADRRRFVETITEARAKAREFVDGCADRILATAPRVLGLSSTFQQNLASLALCRHIKSRDRSVTTILGGANCEHAMGRAIVRLFPWVDAVVSGEGEIAFPEIVRGVMEHGKVPSGIPGVFTAADSGAPLANAPPIANLDDIPAPDYRDFLEQWNAARITRGHVPTLLLETSRGCWWGQRQHCTFCGLNGGSMTYRSKSPENALSTLRSIVDRSRTHMASGVRVAAVDNILDMRYFKDFLPSLAAERASLELFYEVKANLRKQQVCLLRDSGVTRLQPGIESLSTQVLGLMRKGVRGLQNIQLLKWCKEYGVVPEWNFLYGFPGEDPAEYARMAALLPFLAHLRPPLGAARIRLDRFSPNFVDAAKTGFTDVRPYPAYHSVYPGIGADDVAELAYFFEYGYADGRDPAAYTTALHSAVAEWRAAYDTSELVWTVDRPDSIRIIDTRPCARFSTCTLSGAARAVIVGTDAARPVTDVEDECVAAGSTRTEASDILDELERYGYIVREGSLVLGLAIPIGEYRLRPAAVHTLRRRAVSDRALVSSR